MDRFKKTLDVILEIVGDFLILIAWIGTQAAVHLVLGWAANSVGLVSWQINILHVMYGLFFVLTLLRVLKWRFESIYSFLEAATIALKDWILVKLHLKP